MTGLMVETCDHFAAVWSVVGKEMVFCIMQVNCIAQICFIQSHQGSQLLYKSQRKTYLAAGRSRGRSLKPLSLLIMHVLLDMVCFLSVKTTKMCGFFIFVEGAA